MSVKNTESKCNLDINIRKSTNVTSEMHDYGVNIIFFPVENIYWKLEVIGYIKEYNKKK